MENPWRHVADLDGQQHYRTLGIHQKAIDSEIRHAYRTLARKLHPDKGGDSASFAQLREAFEILIDPARRLVYDRWAPDTTYRYIPGKQFFSCSHMQSQSTGVSPRAPGGEDELLKQYARNGIQCDAATQLVVTCEVCRRPATKECWTCKMQICDFCTLKQHWKDSKALRVRLAKAEMEKKRQEDAKNYFLQDPNYRTEHELHVIRSFKEAALAVYSCTDAARICDRRLSKFYMWAQTDDFIILAVHLPTGYEDRKTKVECSVGRLLVQSENAMPAIDRLLAVDLAIGEIETYTSTDNRFLVLFLPKRKSGDICKCLFVGDSDGSRCFEPIYELYDVDDEVLLELRVPFWIDTEDIDVHFTSTDVQISVRNQYCIRRSLWTELECISAKRKETTPAIDISRCSWSLEDVCVFNGERIRTLSISFVRPDPTDSEIEWKKGVRQDNKTQKVPGREMPGVRFFADDEDEFRLEDILQAACFKVTAQTFVPSKPWGEWSAFKAKHLTDLSKQAQKHHKELFSR